jgi:hypothetical protein
MMNSSNYTGRAHRSLQSAFGPYTDSTVSPMPDKNVSHPLIAWLRRLIGMSE